MWFVNLLASAATNYATSDNMLGATVVAILTALLFVFVWHRRRRKEGKPGVEPWHLIFSGISGVLIFAVITAGGLFWQTRQSAPKIGASDEAVQKALQQANNDLTEIRQQLEAKQRELVAVKQQAAPPDRALEAVARAIKLKEILDHLKNHQATIERAGIAQLDWYKNPLPRGIPTRAFDALQGDRQGALQEIPKLVQRAYPDDRPPFAFETRKLDNPYYRSEGAKDITDQAAAYAFTEFELNQQQILNKLREAIQKIETEYVRLKRDIAFNF
ncbi:hypothetical protein KIP88_36195 [Bradyrhizobium sp. SRL28]|uniref:hypothetical protein n=1 Tax=Bradyrhizobium sp. SRL28 TaxID=2836178 RepID=UPI001BDE7FDD|nr:hypothetical protein [Bradyrhizobium sp. SRL28]MBT1515905.1 hypothetical protein [Bradyrhizobium sp. SRL28]